MSELEVNAGLEPTCSGVNGRADGDASHQGPSRLAVYVVLSHRYPEQVERLCRAILRSSPGSRVLVFHDARGCSAPRIDHSSVSVIEHTRASDWGSWEIVDNTIAAFRIAKRLFDPDVIALVSGQDYPVQPLRDWEQRFFAQGAGWVGTSWQLTYRPRWGKPYGVGNDELTRYAYRWFRLPFSRALTTSDATPAVITRWILDKVGHYAEPLVDVRVVARGRGYHIGFRAIRTPFGAKQPCYRGSQWIAMDRPMLAALLERHARDRRLRRTYQHSIIPDESYIQTILTPLRQPQADARLTYTEWLVEQDAPRTLTTADLDAIAESGAPFCRKVDPAISSDLLDVLDELSRAAAS